MTRPGCNCAVRVLQFPRKQLTNKVSSQGIHQWLNRMAIACKLLVMWKQSDTAPAPTQMRPIVFLDSKHGQFPQWPSETTRGDMAPAARAAAYPMPRSRSTADYIGL